MFGRVGVPPNLFGKPTLFIRGMMQYQEDVGDQLTKIKNVTIWAPQVQHSAFSDDAYFAAKIKDFGRQGFLINFFNWLFKRGPYFHRIGTNIGEKEADSWFREYPQYILKWLKEKIGPSRFQ